LGGGTTEKDTSKTHASFWKKTSVEEKVGTTGPIQRRQRRGRTWCRFWIGEKEIRDLRKKTASCGEEFKYSRRRSRIRDNSGNRGKKRVKTLLGVGPGSDPRGTELWAG